MLVYPVIHHRDEMTTLVQAQIAKDAGADGVFLISHRNENSKITRLVPLLKDSHENFKVGLNLLGWSNLNALHAAHSVGADMLWFDNLGINSSSESEEARTFISVHGLKMPNIEVFASVAFKYQPHEPNPSVAVENVTRYGFIPTTSGPGTGQAPDLDKIISMKITGFPLAVASGLTPDNIADYKPYITHALVSTGVSLDEYRLNYEKLYLFVRKAKNGRLSGL